MWIRGGGKTLIHKMWIKTVFFLTLPLSGHSDLTTIHYTTDIVHGWSTFFRWGAPLPRKSTRHRSWHSPKSSFHFQSETDIYIDWYMTPVMIKWLLLSQQCLFIREKSVLAVFLNLYPTILCPTLPYPTIPCPTISYHTIPYPTIPYLTISYHPLPYPTIPYPLA